MVISVRVPQEQGERYKRFAEENGMSLSDFIRTVMDSYVDEAEATLRRADQARAKQARIQALLAKTGQMAGILSDAPFAQASDDEIKSMLGEHYA